MYYAPLLNHVDGCLIIWYLNNNTNILVNMSKKQKESIYTEYERFICNEMSDKERVTYLKSGRFSLITKINLGLK